MQGITWVFAIVAIASGVITSAARTPPNDALANWQKWLQLLGFQNAPQWILKPEKWVGWVFFTSLLLVVLRLSVWLLLPNVAAPPAAPTTSSPSSQDTTPSVANPFTVVLNVPIWSRTWGTYKETFLSAFAVSKGFVRAISNDRDNAGLSIDLLVNFDVTNVSTSTRRITEYQLAVAEHSVGPWTYLCPINFRFPTHIYTVLHPNPNGFTELLPQDYFDQKLTARPMQQGESVAGTTGWVCPHGSRFDCRPLFTKVTIYDSLGQRSEYIQSRELSNEQEVPHDWMAAGYFKAKLPDRNFPTEPAIEGVCPGGTPNR